MSTEPPSGTAAEVLAWVDDDPDRAVAALNAELVSDSPRSTLIAKLETIADKEAPVSDQTTTTEVDEAQAEQEELAPVPPTDVVIDANDSGLTVMPLVTRDADVDAEPSLMPEPEAPEADERESVPIEGDPVESLEAVAGPNGVVIGINGTGYGFNADMTANLKQIVDKAVVGLSL